MHPKTWGMWSLMLKIMIFQQCDQLVNLIWRVDFLCVFVYFSVFVSATWEVLSSYIRNNPLRPTGYRCPANVIAYIFTIKLLHLLFLATIDQDKVMIYKKLKKKIKWCYKFLVTWPLILLIFIISKSLRKLVVLG